METPDIHSFARMEHHWAWGGVGGDDCTTICAAWLKYSTGFDPAEGIRGTYGTAEEAQHILRANGGIVSFIERQLAPVGFTRTNAPQTGDIGVVRSISAITGSLAHVGAIRFGTLWLILTKNGMMGKHLDFVAAWHRDGSAAND